MILKKLGYVKLDFNDPMTVSINGLRYRTFIKDGIRIALKYGAHLIDFGEYVDIFVGDDTDVIIQHFSVENDIEGRRIAKNALKDLVKIASKEGITLYVDVSGNNEDIMLYSLFGFKSQINQIRSAVMIKTPRD